MINFFIIIIIIALICKQNSKIRLPLLIVIGLLLVFIYKNNGSDFFSSYLNIFIFLILGFVAILLKNRRDKEELSVTQWFFIFFGLGILLFILFII